jgi:hypothetical protein
MEMYKHTAPTAKDTTARALLWVLLALTLINALMTGYVFVVIHHAVGALQQLGDAFDQLGNSFQQPGQ